MTVVTPVEQFDVDYDFDVSKTVILAQINEVSLEAAKRKVLMIYVVPQFAVVANA